MFSTGKFLPQERERQLGLVRRLEPAIAGTIGVLGLVEQVPAALRPQGPPWGDTIPRLCLGPPAPAERRGGASGSFRPRADPGTESEARRPCHDA